MGGTRFGSARLAVMRTGGPSRLQDVRAAAKAGEPGYKTILKLLTEGKYNKP